MKRPTRVVHGDLFAHLDFQFWTTLTPVELNRFAVELSPEA